MPALPPVTQALLLINVAMFALDYLLHGLLTDWFGLWPLGSNFLPFQVVTYAFLHGGLNHLFFNMLGVWMFGAELERVWGPKKYLQFYAASLLTAALTQLLVNALLGSRFPTVGASGALFGLLLAYGLLFPRRIILLFFVLPVPAGIFAIGYGLFELYNGVMGTQSGVAHFAHLGGMLGGFLMIRYWRGQSPFGRR
jgi:membrane associated rhomboid family serine protease